MQRNACALSGQWAAFPTSVKVYSGELKDSAGVTVNVANSAFGTLKVAHTFVEEPALTWFGTGSMASTLSPAQLTTSASNWLDLYPFMKMFRPSNLSGPEVGLWDAELP